MNRLKHKVAEIMSSHGTYPSFSLATLLHAGSLLYGRMNRKRQEFFDSGRLAVTQLPCPVVSIGNITAGGTGKTPMTLHLAQLLDGLGYKVAILSRGYKGAAEKNGTVVSDRGEILCDPRDAGDEPMLMAKTLPKACVLVGRNRSAQGELAIEKFNPDVILLDDGYQHRQLARDLNLLILDARAPIGNSYLIPRGSLREPVSAISRADAVIYTRCNGDSPRKSEVIEKIIGPRPVFHTEHRPVIRGIVPAGSTQEAIDWSSQPSSAHGALAGRTAAAFSGLANNGQFWETVSSLGGGLTATMGFDDHHAYDRRDFRRIVDTVNATHCDCLVTTEKDLVRLPTGIALPVDLIVLGVQIEFGDDDRHWRQFITDRLRRIISGDNQVGNGA